MTRTDDLVLRPATPDDAPLLLRWANDPGTRAAGFHPAPIGEAEHRRWLAARLDSEASRLFIGMIGRRPVGQLRLERADDGRVEISIGVALPERGRGVGRRLLAAGIEAGRAERWPGFRGFVARVRRDNAASLALFLGAGFKELRRTEVNGIPCVVFGLD